MLDLIIHSLYTEPMRIHTNEEATLCIERSSFIAYLLPCEQEETFTQAYQNLKKLHREADHFCYGIVLENTTRNSDDGEPGGTAGLPILQSLLRRNIDNAAIVVVRYFGGIKLGKGGLFRAYSAAAEAVLKKAPLFERYEVIDYKISLPYELAHRFRHYLENHHLPFRVDYDEQVMFHFSLLPEANLQPLLELTKGQAPQRVGCSFHERQINHV